MQIQGCLPLGSPCFSRRRLCLLCLSTKHRAQILSYPAETFPPLQAGVNSGPSQLKHKYLHKYLHLYLQWVCRKTDGWIDLSRSTKQEQKAIPFSQPWQDS